MEATAIQLRINSELITLVSIYNPPGKIVERDIDLLIQTSNKVILAGDFNSKHSTWNSRNDNSAGRALLSHYNKHEYLIAAPHSPTHIPDRNPEGADVLDFAILNNILSHYTVKTLGFLSHSDHRPVLLTIRGPLQSDERKTNYVYKEANWEYFRSWVHNNLNSTLLSHNPKPTTNEIDKAVSHFTDVVHTAIQKSVPIRTRNSRSMQIAPSTRLLIQERNKLRTLWQKTHNIALRPRINSLKQQIDMAIKNQLCSNWHHTLQNLDTNNIQDTWRITKHLTNDHSNIPPLKLNNKSAITQQEKVNLFADTLQDIFTTNPDQTPEFSKTTEHDVMNFLNQSPTPLVRKTNFHEIGWLIRHLKSRKAAGPDGIQNIVLKNLPVMALRYLATIYNSCIAISYFPVAWKFAKIIMLPKPNKDHSSPLNYRPISLLNSLAKLFEKILLKRLHFILKKLNLIREDQYGFKKGHSTSHALLRLIERITLGFNNNKSTIALFLDIERAFDKVWITGLISKLIKAGVPAHLIHMLHSYLHNRSFTVVHGNSESSRRPIQAGVPQGSLLGPTLFNIYINDLPCLENDNNVAVSMYADDTSVTVRSGSTRLAIRKLTDAIEILQPWFSKWRIKINTNKCSTVLFSKRRSHIRDDPSPLKIFHTTINWTNQINYLGVILDSKFIYRAHINRSLCAANHRLRQLYPILNKSSPTPSN
jgi:hypothetical protein